MIKNKPFLFIIDTWQKFDLAKDSSIAMARAVINMGYPVEICEVQNLFSQNINRKSAGIFAHTQKVISAGSIDGSKMKVDDKFKVRNLSDFTAVLMRKDPPFNMEYVSALWLLRTAKQQGAVVVNNPEEVLLNNEKTTILEFSQFIAPTLISRSQSQLLEFIKNFKDVVLKPLDSLSGIGVRRFNIKSGEREFNKVFAQYSPQMPIMVQKYLPQIKDGDKRVFIIGGKVVPYGVIRFQKNPLENENLGHLTIDVVSPINAAERKIAEGLAPILKKRGLIIVGIDVIGGHLTEINVTSPTCMIEVERETGTKVAEMAIKAVFQYAKK